MFVYLPRRGWYGTIAMACTLAIGACTSSDQPSDLRTGGPLEVFTVDLPGADPRVQLGEEAPGSLIEVPTFCKTQGPNDGAQGAGDPKRPSTVTPEDLNVLTICPDDLTMGVPELTTADPTTWYARIEFDELLDPSVEDLVPVLDMDGNPTGTYSGTLVNTQPVILQCDSSMGSGAIVDVPYDGYYSPAGNSQSYPLGPSLVIQPLDPTVIATQAECSVTIKDTVTSKDGAPVPADQRGPYKWKIAPILVTAIAPTDGSMVDPVAAGVDLTFNTAIDEASLDKADAFSPTVTNVGSAPESPTEFFVFGDFPAAAGPYTFSLLAGKTLTDQCGKTTNLGTPSVANMTQTSFSTNPLMLMGITGADNPGDMIDLQFNQYMDTTTLTAFTVTPTPANMTVLDGGNGVVQVYGNFMLATSYTFTLNAGATVKDCPGDEADPVTGACTIASSATFTNGAAQSVQFTTASQISLTGIKPADNSSVVSGTNEITLTFNQEMDPSTLTSADYTISPAVALTTSEDSNETLGLTGNFAPGTYTFTLKGSASISDFSGGTFTPGTDQVIHITVTAPPAPGSGCL